MRSLGTALESILDSNAGITDIGMVKSFFNNKVNVTYNKRTGRFDVMGGVTIDTPERASVPWGEINGKFCVVDCTINASNMPNKVCGIMFTRAQVNTDVNKTICIDTFGKTLDNSIYNGYVAIYGLKMTGRNILTFDATDLNRKQVFGGRARVESERMSTSTAKKLAFVGFDYIPPNITDKQAKM